MCAYLASPGFHKSLLLGPIVLPEKAPEVEESIATYIMARSRSVHVYFLLSHIFVLQNIKYLLSFS